MRIVNKTTLYLLTQDMTEETKSTDAFLDMLRKDLKRARDISEDYPLWHEPEDRVDARWDSKAFLRRSDLHSLVMDKIEAGREIWGILDVFLDFYDLGLHNDPVGDYIWDIVTDKVFQKVIEQNIGQYMRLLCEHQDPNQMLSFISSNRQIMGNKGVIEQIRELNSKSKLDRYLLPHTVFLDAEEADIIELIEDNSNKKIVNYDFKDGKITSISLSNTGIAPLIAKVFELTNLEELWLGSNWIKDIPDSIAKLSKLTNLSLNRNQLKTLPESIGELRKLESLSVYWNELEILPESFGNLVNIETLYLDKNKLSALPKNFGNLEQLYWLELQDNVLCSLPESFGKLSSIARIELQNNQLETLPDTFGEMSTLTRLYLQDNKLQSFPDNFDELVNLELLDMRNNSLKVLPKCFEGLKKLEYFYWSGNNIQDIEFSFSSLPKLSAKSLLELGRGYFKVGKHDLAIKCLKRAIDEVTRDKREIRAACWYTIAQAYDQLENLEDAEKSFMLSLSLLKKDQDIAIGFAEFLKKQKRYDEVEKILLAVSGHRKKKGEVLSKLAGVYALKNNIAECIKCINKGMRSKSGLPLDFDLSADFDNIRDSDEFKEIMNQYKTLNTSIDQSS